MKQVGLLQHNIDLNADRLRGCVCRCAAMGFGENIHAPAALGLGLEPEKSSAEDLRIGLEAFDVLLGSDIGYDISLHEPVAWTVSSMLGIHYPACAPDETHAGGSVASVLHADTDTNVQTTTHTRSQAAEYLALPDSVLEHGDTSAATITNSELPCHHSGQDKHSHCGPSRETDKRVILVEEARWEDIFTWFVETLKENVSTEECSALDGQKKLRFDCERLQNECMDDTQDGSEMMHATPANVYMISISYPP
jgi:hypothetical protein